MAPVKIPGFEQRQIVFGGLKGQYRLDGRSRLRSWRRSAPAGRRNFPRPHGRPRPGTLREPADGQKSRGHDNAPMPGKNVRPHDNIGDIGLVLKREEDRALGGAAAAGPARVLQPLFVWGAGAFSRRCSALRRAPSPREAIPEEADGVGLQREAGSGVILRRHVRSVTCAEVQSPVRETDRRSYAASAAARCCCAGRRCPLEAGLANAKLCRAAGPPMSAARRSSPSETESIAFGETLDGEARERRRLPPSVRCWL